MSQATQKKKTDNIVDFKFPRDNTLEQAFLCAILLENSLIDEATAIITPEDLFNTNHRIIFRAMIRLSERNEPIDLITVSSELKEGNEFEQVGGMAYLAEMLTGEVRVTSLKGYASKILRLAQRRRLIKAGKQIEISAIEEPESPSTDLLLNARTLIDNVAIRTETEGFTNIGVLGSRELDRIENIATQSGKLLGVPSGFTDLDLLTCGFQQGDLIIVAARPSVGKTSFALSIAQNAAAAGLKIGFFSLEMTKSALVNRILCSLAQVDSHRVRGGFLSKDEWSRLWQAQATIANWQIMLDDSNDATIPTIRAKARRLKAEHGLDLLIADYLQLMRPADKKNNREQEISEISRGCKSLAKELNVPFIALSQLSRKSEDHPQHRPMLSDLRESGSQEQDADLAILLYRADMYADTATQENQGVAEAIIAKQRNGPTDTVKLAFIKQYTRFENLWRDHAN